ncbi:RBBP5, partial [Cordylochernes scorpioides]
LEAADQAEQTRLRNILQAASCGRKGRLGVSHKQSLVDGKDALEYPSSGNLRTERTPWTSHEPRQEEAKRATVLPPELGSLSYNGCCAESFGQSYPEEFDGTLDSISLAVTCQFNKRGTLLAVGCNDGRIVIWDFLTRGIAKIITAHVHPVCSLSWSRNGRLLLSASTDNTVAIWDALTGECENRFRFPSPILKAQFNPRNSKMFLVCPMKHSAVLVNLGGPHELIPLDDEVGRPEVMPSTPSLFLCDVLQSDLNIVASFDRRGNYIYTGNAKGKILAIQVDNLEIKASFRVTTGTFNTTGVKSIEFSKRGDFFLVSTADRIIRVYETGEVLACGRSGEPEPIQKLQDLVNKTMWKKCCFSGDGEYICAGSARQHALYIWEKSIGNLVKILHGTKGELLLDVVWHPLRPIIASISSGVVSLWAQAQVENWSAFAPDFKELDENVEYEERESEFDADDEDRSPAHPHGGDQTDTEDGEVDVTTVQPIPAFCSRCGQPTTVCVGSDEESEDPSALLYLPIAPEIDDPEETWNAISDQVHHKGSSIISPILIQKGFIVFLHKKTS